jgi:SPP1 family predicted phage head-tail adaptor
MAAGKFRERVTFQRQGVGDDGYGNVTTPWTDHLTVWADVLEGLGRERVAAGRLESPKTATIRIRQSTEAATLTEADRVMARDVAWNIRSIVRVGRKNDVLELLCEAGVAT